MKTGLHRARGSRRAAFVVLVTLLVILAPVCRALCVEPTPGATPAVSTGMAAADCHGTAILAETDDPDGSSSCCADEDRQTTQDRHQPAPSALAVMVAPIAPDLSDRIAVAFRHRLDPGLHAQGPPLRFLTLRFIE